jgi:arabinan endo-1,5-alpha-L-arabinosidase
MRRTLLLAVLALLVQSPVAAAALRYSNPLRDPKTHHALSCPDPHVIDLKKRGFRYIMVCTTDLAANGIALKQSRDLVHWYPAGYVFPRRHQPWWARGRFWAPEIYRIHRRWLVYFAASVDSGKARIPVKTGTMVLGVATSTALHGPWHTRILHYRGQFNGSGAAAERSGGTIDPSVVRSPATGQLYLFWTLQPRQIWAGKLSPDGMTLAPSVRPVVNPSRPWECHPSCVVEAPEPFFRGGSLHLLYSGASTWDGSYALGLALGNDPLAGSYTKLDQPVLRAGSRFIAPGGSTQPVTGPDGRTYVLYHALTSPDLGHVSNRRLLMLAPATGEGNRLVVNKTGRAG